MAKSKGLGKGLKALISEDTYVTEVKEDNGEQQLVLEIKTNKIRPNAEQPRRKFDKDKLEELAASIREHGVIQPIIVRPEKNGYTIVAGERRWRAATIAGLKEMPVIIKDLEPKEVLEIALIENMQRENLNPMEEAKAYEVLVENFNLTQGEIGIRIGKSRAAVANTLRLLKLPLIAQRSLEMGNISAGHARALLGLEDESRMGTICQEIVEKNLSVRETEALIKRDRKEGKKEDQKVETNPYIVAVEDELNTRFATKVKIKDKGEKGKIEIDYYSMDDLNRILETLGYTIRSDDGKSNSQ